MLKAVYKPGDEIFFTNGPTIEKHTIVGSFELKGEMKYAITPYGNLSTLAEDSIFKTFEEAHKYIEELGQGSVTAAMEQLKAINLLEEKNVVVYPNTVPTEEEMVADELEIAKELPVLEK